MHVYTSITTNYLPKARVLATSLKRIHPDAVFHLMLADAPPPEVDLGQPFDTVLKLHDLGISDWKAWAFKHSLVELCTAVKGSAALEIVRRHKPDVLFYLDPDIVVFGRLDGLVEALKRHGVLLTPHLTEPEIELAAIEDNEICALQHGIYNLGFLGINPACEGGRFLYWWANRLLHYCYDDIPRGLFTDQRWVDFAPAYFPEVGIVREPQYNVATWNLTTRRATGRAPDGIFINDRPLVFFHFSGFDSGAQEYMLKRYGSDSPVLFELRDWYVDECERMGQSIEGKQECVYNFFADGTQITRSDRLRYRESLDLQRTFLDPFSTADPNHSYLHWLRANTGRDAPPVPTPVLAPVSVPTENPIFEVSRELKSRLAELEAELDGIRSSRAWKLTQFLRKIRMNIRMNG